VGRTQIVNCQHRLERGNNRGNVDRSGTDEKNIASVDEEEDKRGFLNQ